MTQPSYAGEVVLLGTSNTHSRKPQLFCVKLRLSLTSYLLIQLSYQRSITWRVLVGIAGHSGRSVEVQTVDRHIVAADPNAIAKVTLGKCRVGESGNCASAVRS